MRASRLLRASSLESKWLKKWEATPKKTPTKGERYQLSMFPYPSGALHCGHLRVYTISDALARFWRYKGHNVLHPIGFDAFGLPAENAAIERGIKASDWTWHNIRTMREHIKMMGVSFDWDREVVTCSPDYYKHTQKLFLMLHEAGLAYRAKALVNWDPVDKSVLANEQVDAQGRSWRSGAVVEQRELEQWFLKITNYAEELTNDLDFLEEWPQHVRQMQRNWIGMSSGYDIDFGKDITVFTTRPDTLGGVQFVALSLDHPMVKAKAATDSELASFISRTFEHNSKEGFLVGEAPHPLGGTVPTFAAPYVISSYGTGAVMGVPAHDERDAEFWKINGTGPVLEAPPVGAIGTPRTKFRLRDWLISRQRYWGAPIPMVHCSSCGTVPVPDEQLPVELPEDHTGSLASCTEWIETECPKCHGPAKRDPDTMDTFMDSSWYFLRYTDASNPDKPFDYEAASKYMPVDLYIGGVEHAILHLLYSRFLSKFLAQNEYSSSFHGEPFKRLVTQGMVQAKTFIEPETGRFLKPEEHDNGIIKATGAEARVSYEKMSKSKHNGVSPVEMFETYGSDATRAYILFSAPVTEALNWDSSKIAGVERWLRKVSTLTESVANEQNSGGEPSAEAWNTLVARFNNITESLESRISLNTVVSDLMIMTQQAALLQNSRLSREALRILLISMSPVCPFNAEENWEKLGNTTSIFHEDWPSAKPFETAECKLVVMLNGRKLDTITLEGDLTESVALEAAKTNAAAKAAIEKGLKRVIFKPTKKQSILSLIA